MKQINGKSKNGFFTRQEVRDGLFHLGFDDQISMSSTLLRFQESFDCSEFRGRIFTFDDYVDWYVSKNKEFDYFSWVIGCNFPGRTLKPFYAGNFNPLTRKEQAILDAFENENLDEIYIIATYTRHEFKHEFAHGLYHLNEDYRREVNEVLDTLPLRHRRILESNMAKKWYHPDSWDDEINAKLVEPRLHEQRFNCPQRRELLSLFREHAS